MTDDNVTKFPGLPIPGYVPQTTTAIDLVTLNKRHEETILRALDALATLPGIDQRWLAVGRTHIEQGYMAVNRAVLKPQRIALPTDEVAT